MTGSASSEANKRRTTGNEMRVFTLHACVIACTILTRGSAALAQTPEPVFWTFQPPKGVAVRHGNIIEMVNVHTIDIREGRRLRNPVEVAAEVIEIIRRRRLRAGQICILPTWVGMGGGSATAPIFGHHIGLI